MRPCYKPRHGDREPSRRRFEPEDSIEPSPIALLSFADNAQPITIALVIAFLVISLGIHEAAHGWTALQCGDTTARDLGRITLNPFAHIDLFMTIILPIVCILSPGQFLFGGAKPVPVNFHALRRPYRDMALVALAGPASNVVLAALAFAVQRLLVVKLGIWEPNTIGDTVLDWTISVNLLLAAFNLLPIPPLDGSRVMTFLLPTGLREAYQRLEAFGLLLVVVCVFLVPPVQELMWESIDLLRRFVEYTVTLGGLW